jgi:hypothetical protein
MSSPAERIYEAAAGALADQQSKVGRLTSAVAPIGATATAGALLLEPATNALGSAQAPQAGGFAVGVLGLLLVLVGGIGLLINTNIEGPPPELLYNRAKARGNLDKPDPFHLDAAFLDLGDVWDENERRIARMVNVFRVLVLGLVLELAGLGVAALRPGETHAPSPAPASLHLTSGQLNSSELSMVGALAQGAQGRVRIAVSLSGRSGEVVSRHPSIHGGRFKVRISVPRAVAPLRAASYTITWAGSSAVARAYLAGTIARCPGACR